MPRIPFGTMPRKQQVAVIMSLQKKGLWMFKPLEKFKEFDRWTREFRKKLLLVDKKDLVSSKIARKFDMKGGFDLDITKGVDDIFQDWANEGPEFSHLLISETAAGIKNSRRFGPAIHLPPGFDLIPEEIKLLTRYRALNQVILKEKFPTGKITLFRGVRGNQARYIRGLKRKKVQMDHHFLTSYTENAEAAESFAFLNSPYGVVLKTTFPIERSAYSWRILGEPFEIVEEHFIFGGKFPVEVFIK